MKKISRTISGVTPIAVMAKPAGCPGNCVYCPSYADSPRSYTPESPAVLRAKRYDYDPIKQIEERIRTLSTMGHPIEKVELIVMGGTFMANTAEYRCQFIKSCYDGLNEQPSATLEEAKQINETAKNRCVGLCIETRPDWCMETQIREMLDYGTTRVELGVQATDDDIYRIVRRGHTVDQVIQATRLLKNYGFKVYYHWMPGLPGSTIEHDIEMAECLFSNPDFRPDGLKLYPTLVISGTELHEWYSQGIYKPYAFGDLVDLMIGIKSFIPGYVRIPRLMRDIPTKYIEAGCKDPALRSSVKKKMDLINKKCNCIRCREYGHRLRDGWAVGNPQLKRLDYTASGEREIFLSFEDEKGTLFALLRLRQISSMLHYRNLAMVREIHVFGSEVPLKAKDPLAAQHKGFGSQLLKEAERIARKEFQSDQIAIISGVGARDYFRSEFNYSLENNYMVKRLAPSLPGGIEVASGLVSR